MRSWVGDAKVDLRKMRAGSSDFWFDPDYTELRHVMHAIVVACTHSHFVPGEKKKPKPKRKAAASAAAAASPDFDKRGGATSDAEVKEEKSGGAAGGTDSKSMPPRTY